MEKLKENKLPKIYIADNTEDNNLIDYFKQSENFDFAGASCDGAKAVEEILSIQPEVLVMEVMLQNLDGFAVLEKIKSLKDKMPKVFFVSKLSHSGFVTKALQSGASYFMVKPISPENLETRIFEVFEIIKINPKISNLTKEFRIYL